MKEPSIIINGFTLREGHAMTVRVAIESFAQDLVSTGLGDDEHGKTMTKLYLKAVDEIRGMMFGFKHG